MHFTTGKVGILIVLFWESTQGHVFDNTVSKKDFKTVHSRTVREVTQPIVSSKKVSIENLIWIFNITFLGEKYLTYSVDTLKVEFILQDNCNNEETEEYVKLSGRHYLPKNYSRILAPNNEPNDNPLEIILEIDDLDIIEVDDIKFTVTMGMHLGLHWEDSRIIQIGTNNQDEETPLDLKLLKLLWLPDLDLYNLKQLTGFKVIGKSLAGKG